MREMGVVDQPKALLRQLDNVTLVENPREKECCGFGGAFAVKYPDLSGAIVSKKTANVEAAGAETLLAGDLGCLMNMAGRLSRDGSAIEVRHVTEVLAGMADGPAIGKTK